MYVYYIIERTIESIFYQQINHIELIVSSNILSKVQQHQYKKLNFTYDVIRHTLQIIVFSQMKLKTKI